VSRTSYDYVDSSDQLERLCDQWSGAEAIAFDTEFVSEDTYRPELCLIQVAADGHLAIIDPIAIEDVSPFWRLLAAPNHETIVHAGREEFRFCRHAVGQRPHGWFDTQLAAAFVGLEYPAAYQNLASRLLNQTLRKGETRTDWRRRPLSDRQLDYAILDVIHLEPLRNELLARIENLGRSAWLDEEIESWLQQVEHYDDREQWRRVSGISSLSRRSLAIVRALWRWRENEARSRNKPARRILRDDLIVELARRESSEVRQIQAIRGLERGNLKRHLPELSDSIEAAMVLPAEELPHLNRRSSNQSNFTLLGQFLNTALGCICRSSNLAPTLVGTVQDVRDLIAYRLEKQHPDKTPALIEGWRAEVVGRRIDEVLQGNLAIRVSRPRADQPLEFVPISPDDEDL
jgi:ribonuclease D